METDKVMRIEETPQLNYSKFMTIIRQICKKNKIAITSQIKYDKSKYCIHYFIYF